MLRKNMEGLSQLWGIINLLLLYALGREVNY